MAEEFASAVRPTLEPQLEQGETLRGVVAATYQRNDASSLTLRLRTTTARS